MDKASWRDQFQIHPAAEVFPMLPEDELTKLGEDIRANGLREPIVFVLTAQSGRLLLDGRNRLEAMEMAGMSLAEFDTGRYTVTHTNIDPYTFVISKNLRRRHLSKAEQVDIIIRVEKERERTDLIKNIRSVERDPKGQLQGSTKDPIRERVIEQAKDLHISKASVEKGFARERMGPADQILGGLEKKKKRKASPDPKRSPLFKPVASTLTPKQLDDNPRRCTASCCPEGSDIAGPWNVHDAQAVLDGKGFLFGYFGKDHDALLGVLVEVDQRHGFEQFLHGSPVRGMLDLVPKKDRYRGIGQ